MTQESLFTYVAARFAEFFDNLSNEERSMWYGEEAIYDRKQAIWGAMDELEAAGIDTMKAARAFDLESLWE